MTDCEREIMEIFCKLSPENQNHLLAYARLAYIAECSVKRSLLSLLEQGDQPIDPLLQSFLQDIVRREQDK